MTLSSERWRPLRASLLLLAAPLVHCGAASGRSAVHASVIHARGVHAPRVPAAAVPGH